MSSTLLGRARQEMIRRLADARRNRPGGEAVSGHHNTNYIAPLGWPLALLLGSFPLSTCAKYRTPLETVQVVPRIWASEAELVRVVSRYLAEVPRCLADFGDWSLHQYRKGRALSDALPHGPVGEQLMNSFAEFFARTASIPPGELPPLPANWPRSGDSIGFLHWLADFTVECVELPNRARFGDLFDAVGIPRGAMGCFKEAYGELSERPFCLLHTDVHRANTVVDGDRMSVIDWELAIYGDPLHDLATHLVRMDYDKDEQNRMTALWSDAMVRNGHRDRTSGLDTDLRAYLAFEYVQSMFPDVMRAALALPKHPDHRDFTLAARRVRRAMWRAREPLHLVEVPEEWQAAEALRAWHATDADG